MADTKTTTIDPDEEKAVISVDDLENGLVVQLGRQGETRTQTVSIDCTRWLEQNGLSSLSLSVVARRPGESEVYIPANQSAPASGANKGILTWTIDSADTQIAGVGDAEIRGETGTGSGKKVKKSCVFRTRVQPSLEANDASSLAEPPTWAQATQTRADTAAAQAAEALSTANSTAEDVTAVQEKLRQVSPAVRDSLYGATALALPTPMGKYFRRDLRMAILPQNLFNPWFDTGKSRINGQSQAGCLTSAGGLTVTYSAGKYTLSGTYNGTVNGSWPRKANGSAAAANQSDALTFGTLLPPGEYIVPALDSVAVQAGLMYFCSVIDPEDGNYLLPPMTTARTNAYTFTIYEDAVVHLRFTIASHITAGTVFDNVDLKLGICRADSVYDAWAHGVFTVTATNTYGTATRNTDSLVVRGCTWLSDEDILALGLNATSSTCNITAKSGTTPLPVYADWIVPISEYMEKKLTELKDGLSGT